MTPLPCGDHQAESPTVALLPSVALLAGSIDGVRDLQLRLQADAIDAELLDLAAMHSKPPDHWSVIVACLPVPIRDERLSSVMSWCRRARGPIGVIGYSPLGTSEDCERGLLHGFDDFVVDRHSPREVSARVRALSRRMQRSGRPQLQRIVFGRLSLDLERHEISVGNYRAALTRLELLLVKCLIETAGRPVTRDELLARIWGADNTSVGLRAVDNLVWRLRRKLGPVHVFGVVRGVGFQLLP
jgi:DNA-binding response OmpR family regulator